MKRHRRHGHGLSQTVITATALCGILMAAVVLLFPLWKAMVLQIGDSAQVQFKASAPGQSPSAQSVLSLRRDLLGLAWTGPVTADRWFATPPAYQAPAADTADSEGRIAPTDGEQSPNDPEVAAGTGQPSSTAERLSGIFATALDDGTHTLEIQVDGALQTGHNPPQKSSSVVRNAQFTALNALGAREWLNRRVVALNPGQSAYFYPSDFSDGLRPRWENGLTLVVIALGATADRVDAPGKLSVEPLVVPRPVNRKDQKEGSRTADQESGRSSSTGESRPLVYTVAEDPATHFEVSHVPQVEDLKLSGLVNEQQSPDALRLTWSSKSSGTLLVLGIRKEPAVQTADQTPPGFLLMSADELAHPEPSLPNTRSQLQQLAGSSEIIELHEVWPAHPDELQNHLALLGKAPADQEPPANEISEFGRQNYRGVIRIDLISNGASLPPLNPLAGLADARAVIEADPWGRTPIETTAQIASLVATGFLVHLHVWWKPESLPLSHISWQTLAANLFQGRLSDRLASTLLAGPDSPRPLRNRETFSRMDAFEASLLGLLPAHPQPTVFLHIARQPNVLKREIVRLIDDVPLEYAPGYAAVLPGERWQPPSAPRRRVEKKGRTKTRTRQSEPQFGEEGRRDEPSNRFFPVESPTTQEGVLSALLMGLIQKEASGVALVTEPLRTEAGGSGTVASHSSGGKDDPSGLVAAVTGSPGSLFVFDRGWIFVPGLKAPGSSKPVYGVPLEDLVEARKSIYAHLNKNPIRLVSVDVLKAPGSDVQLEWRSEFPFSACSASAADTAISQKVSDDAEGWMQVKVSLPPGEGRVLATCIIDLSEKNPIPRQKRDADKTERGETGHTIEALPIQFSLRVMESGKKLPITNFVFGPYRESGETLSLSKAGVELNLEEQTERLMKVTAPSRNEESLTESGNTSETRAWIYMSPGSQLPLDHPVQEDWEILARAFVRDRLKLASQLRESRL